MSAARGVTATVAMLGLGVLLGAPAGAAAGVHTDARATASGAATARYWTPQRIASARPLALDRGGIAPRLRPSRNHPVPFTSAPVADPTVFPNPTNGKLLGRLREFGPFECSATVVSAANRSVVFTAGHCVFDPFENRFAKRLAFIPAYDQGAEPLGRWTWSESETTRQWMRKANANFDYATIVMRPRAGDGALVEDVAGARGLVTSYLRAQNYSAFGYPGNLGDAQQMWSCASAYAGEDPRPFRVGRPPIAIGCDMTAGASGGGWITGAGQLASVSSFGYRAHPEILYGPYLRAKAARMVARAGSR